MKQKKYFFLKTGLLSAILLFLFQNCENRISEVSTDKDSDAINIEKLANFMASDVDSISNYEQIKNIYFNEYQNLNSDELHEFNTLFWNISERLMSQRNEILFQNEGEKKAFLSSLKDLDKESIRINGKSYNKLKAQEFDFFSNYSLPNFGMQTRETCSSNNFPYATSKNSSASKRPYAIDRTGTYPGDTDCDHQLHFLINQGASLQIRGTSVYMDMIYSRWNHRLLWRFSRRDLNMDDVKMIVGNGAPATAGYIKDYTRAY